MGFFSKLFKKQPKKLGLGLGGGGAKGSVHLGVIRAFEEEGITFDTVAGTSIGSIVGGLYARGYTSREIENFIVGSVFGDLKRLVVARFSGQGVDGIIASMLGKVEFTDLKIPFAAVAVDLDSGEEKVFTDGTLSKCMGASSAIPPYFKAVTIDGKRYVDGAYRNIVPCDVARGLGADFVVGVDLSNHRETTAQGKRALDDMYPGNGVPVCDPTAAGYAACNYMITPDLREYSSTSFGSLYEMFDIGYFAAKESMPDILAAMKKAGVKFNKK